MNVIKKNNHKYVFQERTAFLMLKTVIGVYRYASFFSNEHKIKAFALLLPSIGLIGKSVLF